MKRFVLMFAIMLTAGAVFAQTASPVNWSYSSKKVSDNVYEVQLTATLQAGWHIYSQTQPKDAIAQPTVFKFNNNPLVVLDGKVKETGAMEKFKDETLDISAYQYSKQVVFTQKVKLKGKAKSNVGGTITFQTCDEKKCLPPKTITFNVALK